MPELEPILKDTYGIMVYQEQLMRIARDVSGFSLGEADILRKAVGKKNAELLAKQKAKFVLLQEQVNKLNVGQYYKL